MKQALYVLAFLFLIGFFSACEKEKDTQEVSELKEEIQRLKSDLKEGGSITEVRFEGTDMLLTFANGSEIKVAAPGSVVPQKGDNGNWWINGKDLGVTAKEEMPTIGDNGNWWVGDADTGVTADGNQSSPGADGTGIASINYNPKTAVLTILLTDNTKYEYVLFYEEAIQGIKLGDVNGKYLLEAIYNGDLPFATFGYNSKNLLTDIKYFKAELNKPTLQASLHREFNAENKVSTQTLTEYSTIEKAVPVGYILPNLERGLEMTPEDAFNEIFPNGLEGYNGNGVDFFQFYDYRIIFHLGYLYQYEDYYYHEENPDGSWSQIRKHIVRKLLVRTDENKQFGVTEENSQIYAWTPYYEWWSNEWDSHYDEYHARPSNDTSVDEYGNLVFDYSEDQYYQIYSYSVPVTEYTTSNPDEIIGNRLKDYMALESGKYENPNNLAGNYKFLFSEYDLYKVGDEIRNITFNYVYNKDDYTVSKDGEDIYNIAVVDNKIKSISYSDDNETVELLQMNYKNEQLVSISSPHYKATDVVTVEYDNKNNPVNYRVNSKLLAGQGHDEALLQLGLAYKSEVYDAELGRVVEKYFYPEAATSLLKLTYDYSMKNFMNHTVTAVNPLFSVFNTPNAIQEFIWAGHGSCFITEYDSFNEGGYPTRFKGLLQIAPQDGNEQGEYPVNASVATSYKLTYKKIKE